MSKGRGQKVNRKQLADIFGVSLPTVDAWVKSGCPYDQKGDRGREWIFDTADVMRWREQLARDDAGDTDTQDDVKIARREKMVRLKIAELDLAERQNEVGSIEVMERAWTRVFAELQSNLRGPLIARMVSQLIGETDERTFKRIARAEVDSALEVLAKMDLTADDLADDGDDAAGGDAD
jgi:phage terminase Nu1 subunit (DNA packaging protein)